MMKRCIQAIPAVFFCLAALLSSCISTSSRTGEAFYGATNQLVDIDDSGFLLIQRQLPGRSYASGRFDVVRFHNDGKEAWRTECSLRDDIEAKEIVKRDDAYLIFGYGSDSGADDDAFVLKIDRKGEIIYEKWFGEKNGYSDRIACVSRTRTGYLAAGTRISKQYKHEPVLYFLDSEGTLIREANLGVSSGDAAAVFGEADRIIVIGKQGWLAVLDSAGNEREIRELDPFASSAETDRSINVRGALADEGGYLVYGTIGKIGAAAFLGTDLSVEWKFEITSPQHAFSRITDAAASADRFLLIGETRKTYEKQNIPFLEIIDKQGTHILRKIDRRSHQKLARVITYEAVAATDRGKALIVGNDRYRQHKESEWLCYPYAVWETMPRK